MTLLAVIASILVLGLSSLTERRIWLAGSLPPLIGPDGCALLHYDWTLKAITWLLAGASLATSAALVFQSPHPAKGDAAAAAAAGAFALFAGGLAFRYQRFQLSYSAEGLSVRPPLGRWRHFAWSDITSADLHAGRWHACLVARTGDKIRVEVFLRGYEHFVRVLPEHLAPRRVAG